MKMNVKTKVFYFLFVFSLIPVFLQPSITNAAPTLHVDDGLPNFINTTVLALNLPEGIQTQLGASVADPNGDVPENIQSLTVVGPNGFNHTFVAAEYNEFFNNYGYITPGLPADGEYTFMVTDDEGKTATTHIYLEVGNTIPPPAFSTLQASDIDPLLDPTLSWGAIFGYEGTLFYRARIFDESGINIIWTSGFTTNTSVNFPRQILQNNTNYQWRVEANDNYTMTASNNRAVSEKIPLSINNNQPYFIWASVFSEYRTVDGFQTSLLASVVDPNGTLPDSIASLTVTGPGGFLHTFQPGDFSGIYISSVEGKPLDGMYTFTLTDTEGESAVTYDYVKVHDVPLVDVNSLRAYGDPLAPTLSWAAPGGMDQSLYYRAVIWDETGNRVWWGPYPYTPFTSINVEPGILQENVSYQWSVWAHDDKNNVHFSNRSSNERKDLIIETSKPYFQWATVHKQKEVGQLYTQLVVQVEDPYGTLPDNIVSLTVTGPGNFSHTLQPQNYNLLSNVYAYRIPGAPSEGVYTFTVVDDEGKSADTHDYLGIIDDMPSVDADSISISGYPTAPTVSWGGISGYQGRPYYSIWVFDDAGNVIYRSLRQPQTTTTMPTGYIDMDRLYQIRVDAHDNPDMTVFNSVSSSDQVTISPPVNQWEASGTWAFDTGTSILTVETTSSDFLCEGLMVGTEQFTVISITETTMILEEADGFQTTWTRDAGVINDPLGTWQMVEGANSWDLTINGDGTFWLVGHIVGCDGGPDDPESYYVSAGIYRNATEAGTTESPLLHFHFWTPQGTANQVVVSGPGLSSPHVLPEPFPDVRGGVPVDHFHEDIVIDTTPQVGDIYTFTVTRSDSTVQYFEETLNDIGTEALQFTLPTGHTLADAHLGLQLDLAWTPTVGPDDFINIYGGVCTASGEEYTWGTATSPATGIITLPDSGGVTGAFVGIWVHGSSVSHTRYEFGTCAPVEGYKITGTVTYTGSMTGTLKVIAFFNNGTIMYPYAQAVGSPYIAPWNPVGGTQVYEITGLFPGTYQVLAYIDEDGTPPTAPGEPVALVGGLNITNVDLIGQDIILDVPSFEFSTQEKVFPFKRGDRNGEVFLSFWARIPEAQALQIINGPGITPPIHLMRSPMNAAYWGGGVSVSSLSGGTIQTGTYAFEATPANDGTPITSEVVLSSVPSTPDPAILVSPYEGNPDVMISLTSITPTFTWNPASGALSHKLRIDQKIGDDWFQIYDSGWGLTGNTYTINMPLPRAVHLCWYVDAYDGTDWPSTTAMSRSVTQEFFIGTYGDVNSDSIVDLGDAILTFQVLGGLSPAGIDLFWDVNGNGKLDLAEAIYILQVLALLR